MAKYPLKHALSLHVAVPRSRWNNALLPPSRGATANQEKSHDPTKHLLLQVFVSFLIIHCSQKNNIECENVNTQEINKYSKYAIFKVRHKMFNFVRIKIIDQTRSNYACSGMKSVRVGFRQSRAVKLLQVRFLYCAHYPLKFIRVYKVYLLNDVYRIN